MAKSRGVHSIIKKSQAQRGNTAENAVYRALVNLRDNYGMPIIFTVSEKWDYRDRSGIDFEIRGAAPLHARFGIDIKSSKKGVDSYLKKQQELLYKGIRNAFPRYPFLFEYESFDKLEFRLIKFILEKSKNYAHAAEQMPDYEEIAGPNFQEDLKSFIASVFS